MVEMPTNWQIPVLVCFCFSDKTNQNPLLEEMVCFSLGLWQLVLVAGCIQINFNISRWALLWGVFLIRLSEAGSPTLMEVCYELVISHYRGGTFWWQHRFTEMEEESFLLFVCLPSLLTSSSSLLLKHPFTNVVINFLHLIKWTEDQLLSRNPLGPQHPIGIAETCSLVGWPTTGFSVWDSHCWTTQTISCKPVSSVLLAVIL